MQDSEEASAVESQSSSSDSSSLAPCVRRQLNAREVNPAGLIASRQQLPRDFQIRTNAYKSSLPTLTCLSHPAWRLKSHKSFSLMYPQRRTNSVILASARSPANFPTAEDVQPVGSGRPGSCVHLPCSRRGAARGDLLPGAALRGTEWNTSSRSIGWCVGLLAGPWRSFLGHFWTCRPVPGRYFLHFSPYAVVNPAAHRRRHWLGVRFAVLHILNKTALVRYPALLCALSTCDPAWRLKSHKSFRTPRRRTNRVISASARSPRRHLDQTRRRHTDHRRRRTRQLRGLSARWAGGRSG